MYNEEKHVIQNNLPLIVWRPEYELGIHIVDEHHRGILTATNSLYYEKNGGLSISAKKIGYFGIISGKGPL